MCEKLNKKLQTLLGNGLILAFLFVLLLSNKDVYADTLSDNIAIEQKISINSPYAKPQDSFVYILESLNENSSLVRKFNLKGDTKKYIDFDYKKAGEYSYKLYQEKSDIENVSNDTEVYYIYVTITETNGKLDKDLLMIKNSSGKKVKEIVFNNRYRVAYNKATGDVKENPNQRTGPKASKNVKTGIEALIIPCLILILSLTFVLIFVDQKSIEE